MQKVYEVNFSTDSSDKLTELREKLSTKLTIKKNSKGNLFVSGRLSEHDLQILKASNVAIDSDFIRALDYDFTETEIESAEFVRIRSNKERSSKVKYVAEVEGNKKALSENEFAAKFGVDSHTMFEIRLGFTEHPNLIGYTIDTPLPESSDILSETQLIAGYVCNTKVKIQIESEGFSGVKFLPIWLSSNKNFDIPDYFLLKSTNMVHLESISSLRIDPKFIAGKFLQLTANQKSNLQDFNFLNTERISEVRLLVKGTTSPDFVSKKVRETLKDLKGLLFVAPVLFK